MRERLGDVALGVTVDEPLARGPVGKVRAVVDQTGDGTPRRRLSRGG
jgi:hypothetical protein